MVDHKLGEAKVANILTYYDLIRKYVEHEDGLINSRLTWSLTVHGFLFAAYGVLLGKALDIGSDLHKPELPSSILSSAFYQVGGICIAVVAIVIVAILIGWRSGAAIVACHNALQYVYAIANKQDEVTPTQTVDRRGALLLAPPTEPTTEGAIASSEDPRRRRPRFWVYPRLSVLPKVAPGHHSRMDGPRRCQFRCVVRRLGLD